MKNKFGVENYFFLVFIVFIMGFSTFFIWQFSEHVTRKNIVKKGVTIEAEVYDYASNLEVNGTPYYYVCYSFEYDGEEKTGKSSTNFSYSQASNMENITVKYYKGKSVEASYTKPQSFTFLIIFFTVMAAVGVGFSAAFIRNLVKFFNGRAIIKSGEVATATYIGKNCNVYVNGRPQYKVNCRFKKLNGEMVTGNAIGRFNEQDVNILEDIKTFSVRYNSKNNKFAIVEDLNNANLIKDLEDEEIEEEIELDKKLNANLKYMCEHCGKIVKPNLDGTCPKCHNIIDHYSNKK